MSYSLLPQTARSKLRHSGLHALWLYTVTSQLSLGMQQVILGWVILELTNTSSMVGVVFALRSAPNLIIGFVAGALTDRIDRRLVLRITNWMMALLSVAIATVIWVEFVEVWHVLIYGSLIGTLRAFEATARQAYVYDLMGPGQAVRGLALNATAQRLGGMLGSLIAGVALQWWGPSAAFGIMGLCYSLGSSALYLLKYRGASAPITTEPLWQNIKTYRQALRNNPILRSLILSTATAEILGFSHQVLIPVIAKDILLIGASGLGLLTAFRFIGGVLGALLFTFIGKVGHQGILLLIVLSLFGVGILGLSQVTQFYFAILCVMGINIMASSTDILHQSLLQIHVPNTQRGRAMGSWVVGTGAAPIGHIEIGYMAGITSVSSTLLIHGLGLTALPFVILWLMPQLRKL